MQAVEMVYVPAGTFVMGAPADEGLSDEHPQHEVTVPEFWMGKYPVTQAQWRDVASFSKIKIDLNPDPSCFKGDDLPVEQVSWDEAVEFCDRLSAQTGKKYRLPTEAEWEYACRAGTQTKYSFGDVLTTDQANHEGERATPVGAFPPNKFGIYDMHGNVWEWCQDHLHKDYKGAPCDGSAWTKGREGGPRVLRGGSWYDLPANCRSAYRNYYSPGLHNNLIGFRVAMDKPQKSKLKKAIHLIQSVWEFVFTPRCTVCGWRYPKHQLREDGTCGMCESHKGVRDPFW